MTHRMDSVLYNNPLTTDLISIPQNTRCVLTSIVQGVPSPLHPTLTGNLHYVYWEENRYINQTGMYYLVLPIMATSTTYTISMRMVAFVPKMQDHADIKCNTDLATLYSQQALCRPVSNTI